MVRKHDDLKMSAIRMIFISHVGLRRYNHGSLPKKPQVKVFMNYIFMIRDYSCAQRKGGLKLRKHWLDIAQFMDER